ncbi:MAG: NAD(P)-dependent oxidoreductase [Methanobacteriota archaeon]
MGSVVLLTGGAGFLGVNLAERLKGLGWRVKVLDMREQPTFGCDVDYIQGDVSNYKDVSNACDDVDVIFNLASLLPCSRAGNMFIKVNVCGTENLCKVATENNVKKLVEVSTSIVYGVPEKIPCDETCALRPVGPYGRSKVEAEKIILEYMKEGLDASIIRPRMIVGPGRLGLLTILFDWIRRNKRVYLIGSGENKFQMVSVYDLVDACMLCMEKGSGEIFNIGEANPSRVCDLIQAVIDHAGSKSKITPINDFIARNALRTLDYFKLTPLNVEHYLIADKEFVLDTSKAERILGWKPNYSAIEMMTQGYDYYMKKRNNLGKGISSDHPPEGLLKLLRFFS